MRSGRTFSKIFQVFYNPDKPRDIYFAFYGLDGKSCDLFYEWPIKAVPAGEVRFEYSEILPQSSGIDHFSFHPQGNSETAVFHLKRRQNSDEELIYAHTMAAISDFSSTSPVFGEFIIQTDFPEFYSAHNKLKEPNFKFNSDVGKLTIIRCTIFGKDYPHTGPSKLNNGESYFIEMFGDYSILFKSRLFEVEGNNARENRPRGTILTFRFSINDKESHLKTFLIP